MTAIDWDSVPDFDILTWSSPCQDISNAGKGWGMTEGSGTRSSLLWEVKKPLEAKSPKYILFENVKNFIGSKNKKDAQLLFHMLEDYGYSVFYKVLNAKDYGVPQNRERIFILAIYGNGHYEFPTGFELEKRLKDVLEENVDERYYLSRKMIDGFKKHNENHNAKGTGFIWKPKTGDDIANCIRATPCICPNDNTISIRNAPKIIETDGTICLNSKVNGKHPSLQDRVYSTDGIATAITTDFRPNIAEPQVLTPKRTEYGKAIRKEYEAGDVKESRHNMTELQPRNDGISNTLTSVQKDNLLVEPTYRIRKLTPRECFRLMDVDDCYIDKMQESGISKTQQYKLAGNSIVVACLYYIFINLFIGYERTTLF